MPPQKQAAYWSYIRVKELLSLQGGLNDKEDELTNDEVLFITVHQVFELWFKLVMREMVGFRNLFKKPVHEQELAGAVHGCQRITTILRRCVDHFEIMETLSTREYLAFRDKLTGASGFQSAQMRQMEILMGLDDSERISLGAGENYMQALREADGSASDALQRVQSQLDDEPSIKAVINDWLYRTPIDGSGPDDDGDEAAVERFIATYAEAHAKEVDIACKTSLARTAVEFDTELVRKRYESEKAALQEWLTNGDGADGAKRKRVRAAILFIISYRELPLLAWPRELIDSIIEMEQHFTIFRQRHARMVERIIGRRTGTGGSAGVDYLDNTALEYRVFKDLWTVRTFQMREQASPKLQNDEFYNFRNQ